ncbi:MAG: hypothetical protein NC416_13385 [Eubacterium sp.]|nr:hypothetical protein [Eubacterium sp.]
MKLKRVMAFVMASMLMMSSMTVLAAAGEKYAELDDHSIDTDTETGGKIYSGTTKPVKGDYDDLNQDFTAKDKWINGTDEYEWKDNDWKLITSEIIGGDGSSEVVSVSAVPSGDTATAAPVAAPTAPKTLSREEIANIVARAETIALQAAARDEGFADVVAMQDAAAKNMSAGEYYNNAAVETPGIEEATPVAQGGGIIINGVVTNAMATISKVDIAFVDSVRAAVEGTVLNVVDVKFPATEATINFYMPGVTADADITAVQYRDGAWVEVEVVEVRADHVVLNVKNGKVAFLAK